LYNFISLLVGRMTSSNMKGDGYGKKVRDLMTPLEKVPWVDLGDDMGDTIHLLYNFRQDCRSCNSAVVSSDDKVVGLLTMRSMLEALEPKAFNVNQWSVPVFWSGLWTEQVKKLNSKKVSDIFVPVKMVGVHADGCLMRAVYCFNKTKMPALAVLDGPNVIGVLEVPVIYEELLRNGQQNI